MTYPPSSPLTVLIHSFPKLKPAQKTQRRHKIEIGTKSATVAAKQFDYGSNLANAHDVLHF